MSKETNWKEVTENVLCGLVEKSLYSFYERHFIRKSVIDKIMGILEEEIERNRILKKE